MSNIETDISITMVTGDTVPRSLTYFNQTFQICFYYATFSNDAEKEIAMCMYVCHITVHSFDLFINDIIIMMNKFQQKYGRRFSRIQSPDVNTRRHDPPAIKNRPTLEQSASEEKIA